MPPSLDQWHLIRLSPHDDPGPSPGKRPIDTNWPDLPPPSEQTVDDWLADGFNLGCATGHGFVVVDIDGPSIPPEFPATLTVRTGRPGGGWHLYYATGEGVVVRNSAGKLGKKIDVRGQGGQVVIPPSRHASGERYSWFADREMAPLPVWIRSALACSGKLIELDWSKLDANTSKWARVALDREISAVANTGEGGRNDQLFRSAAALWEIVNGGNLTEDEVAAALVAAGAACGLGEREIRSVLASARKKTAGKARVPTGRPAGATATPAQSITAPSHIPNTLATVLVPGAHVDDRGEYHEVTPAEFATVALAVQEPHTIFHRGGMAGVIRAGTFVPLPPSGMRIALTCRPYRWVTPKPSAKDPDPKPCKVYVPFSKEHAELVIARAPDHANVGEIRLITSAPVFLAGWELSSPGWNLGGIYQSGPGVVGAGGDLRDLLIDFPWTNEASRQNFIGLLITILVRAALRGNVPLHLIQSTVERTGKTKLVDEIIGILFLGGQVPAMQFAGSDEERDKRILSVLMLGLPIIHLDNLGEWLDSPALASTITAAVYSGRVLGSSTIANVPNLACWVATGNNVAMSGELAKRTVLISLQPKDADPHLRTEFVHQRIDEYVRANRDAILGTLIGMVRAWVDAGCPAGSLRVGGFEDWSAVVGGIMAHAGYTEWMQNYAAWTGAADVEGADMIRFMEDWQTRGGGTSKVSDLRKRATDLGLFERRLGRATTERGQDTAFAMLLRRYLKRAVNTRHGRFTIVETFATDGRMYLMERKI